MPLRPLEDEDEDEEDEDEEDEEEDEEDDPRLEGRSKSHLPDFRSTLLTQLDDATTRCEASGGGLRLNEGL